MLIKAIPMKKSRNNHHELFRLLFLYYAIWIKILFRWFQTIPARPWLIIPLIPRVRIPIITRFSAGIGCIGIITSSDIQMLLILIIRVPASDSTAMILWIWMISTCPRMLDRYSLFVWLFIEQRNRSRNNPMGLSATWAHAFMQTRKTSDRRRYGFDITENHRFRTPSYTSMMTEPTPQEHSFREKHARQQQCEQWPHTMHA